MKDLHFIYRKIFELAVEKIREHKIQVVDIGHSDMSIRTESPQELADFLKDFDILERMFRINGEGEVYEWGDYFVDSV